MKKIMRWIIAIATIFFLSGCIAGYPGYSGYYPSYNNYPGYSRYYPRRGYYPGHGYYHSQYYYAGRKQPR